MAAEVQETNLEKVDSAVSDVPASPTEKKISHRRASSTASNVHNMADLGKRDTAIQPSAARDHCIADNPVIEKEGVDVKIAPETQRLNW